MSNHAPGEDWDYHEQRWERLPHCSFIIEFLHRVTWHVTNAGETETSSFFVELLPWCRIAFGHPLFQRFAVLTSYCRAYYNDHVSFWHQPERVWDMMTSRKSMILYKDRKWQEYLFMKAFWMVQIRRAFYCSHMPLPHFLLKQELQPLQHIQSSAPHLFKIFLGHQCSVAQPTPC